MNCFTFDIVETFTTIMILMLNVEQKDWKLDGDKGTHLRCLGYSSTMAVMTPSMVQNCESRPRNMSMKKKRQLQRGERGIWRTALG